jgi:hypothetical protein
MVQKIAGRIGMNSAGKSYLFIFGGKLNFRLVLAEAALLLMTSSALAQTPGIYVYPAKGQSQAQQDKDKSECHTWAVSQSGFDPGNTQTTAPVQQQKHQVARGAAGGAALGAVGGAITGNPGTGAAAGAAMGGLAGGLRRRSDRRQQQANANAQVSSGQQAYNRALTACLQGRGYTVQ